MLHALGKSSMVLAKAQGAELDPNYPSYHLRPKSQC